MAKSLKDIIEEKIENNLPVRLHLGCGPNIWEGWINVEGEYAANQPGVVLYDITSNSYPIPNNSVDEIFTSHVIEHLMPSSVLPMFKEWHRILKPGGFAATEWPDFIKCVKFILEDETRLYSPDRKILKRGIGGIFGMIDDYQDPAMLHKWGYSERSMIHLKQQAGFGQVYAEPPQHKKTKSDSRVVAYK